MESSVERVLLLAGRQNLVGIMRYLQCIRRQKGKILAMYSTAKSTAVGSCCLQLHDELPCTGRRTDTNPETTKLPVRKQYTVTPKTAHTLYLLLSSSLQKNNRIQIIIISPLSLIHKIYIYPIRIALQVLQPELLFQHNHSFPYNHNKKICEEETSSTVMTPKPTTHHRHYRRRLV